MANNYCISSSKLLLDEEQVKKAQAIIDRVVKELEEGDEEYCGCDAVVEDDGVWFSADESIDTSHMELIARELIDELEIDEPWYASWAYTCSKPRIDEFGGGAFVIKRGYQTYWVDAMHAAQQAVKRGKLRKVDNAT